MKPCALNLHLSGYQGCKLSSVIYNGVSYSVLQTETLALPSGGTVLTTKIRQATVRLQFVERTGTEPRVERDRDAGEALAFILHGFDKQTGASFDVGVGDIDGKLLHLSVIVYGVGTKEFPPRVVTLTFLLEE